MSDQGSSRSVGLDIAKEYTAPVLLPAARPPAAAATQVPQRRDQDWRSTGRRRDNDGRYGL